MTDETEHLLERRRLRRRVGFWRLVAIVAVAGAAAFWFWRTQPGGPYVALHEVTGIIVEDRERNALLRDIARDENAAALLLRIDSPGGTLPGAEGLFAAVREVAERKPVVAVMGEVAASGGYVAALAADRIVARGGTLTGSIGVIAQYPNVEELLDSIGVEVRRVASSPLKAEPSPFQEPSAEALEAQEAIVEDGYEWFVGLVAARRGYDDARARELGDGRVFTGRQALGFGLIDEIGGELEAREWLDRARGVSAALPLRERAIDVGAEDLLDLAVGAAIRAVAESLAVPRLLALAR